MKNSFLLVSSKIIEKLSIFIFLSLLARVSVEDLGEFNYNFSFLSIIFILFNFGGEFYSIKKVNEQDDNLLQLFILKTTVYSLFFVFFYLNNDLLILILSFSFYLDSIISLIRTKCYLEKKFRNDVVFSTIERLIFIVLIVINVTFFENVLLFYIAFVISKIVYIIIFLIKNHNAYLYKSIKFKQLIKLFKESFSYIFHSLLVVLFVQVDVLMIEEYLDIKEVAYYTSATRIFFASLIISEVLGKQYYPLIVKNFQDFKGSVNNIEIILLSIGFLISAFVLNFSDYIINILFGNELHPSIVILQILSSVIMIRYIMSVSSNIISASKFNKLKVYVSMLCLILNVTLNYLVIPVYGIIGATLTTFLTEFILMLSYIYIRKVYCKCNFELFNASIIFISILYFINLYLILFYSEIMTIEVRFVCLLLCTSIVGVVFKKRLKRFVDLIK
ncbi:oligosaccharide flippase family protein [Flammeovirga pacifica]|uniref:Uncharacterized protein n=1 Tax=Flammeovirga pacifica TaxID=915059 RepID=A0A1S1Z1A7_FLAPC|nr:oligosaccharide flippase family protein [Flammeovirga pacifica]OHX67017.1 hypothetical protein NH26_12015 [Flammeovirga pacifica]